jgi:hypothetical protein
MAEQHPGSKELYDRVANWHPGPLLFSKEFGWERWGLLGVIADFILHYTPGCIVEVGCCETSIFLSALGEKYGRQVFHCDLQRSVIENCKTVPGYFGKNSQTFIMPSGEFFKTVQLPCPAALVFIDGDHMYEQVREDFINALSVLDKEGFILLHDTAPPNKDWTTPSTCGTVYKLRLELEKDNDFQIFTFRRSSWDVGLTLVQRYRMYKG